MFKAFNMRVGLKNVCTTLTCEAFSYSLVVYVESIRSFTVQLVRLIISRIVWTILPGYIAMIRVIYTIPTCSYRTADVTQPDVNTHIISFKEGMGVAICITSQIVSVCWFIPYP